MSSKEAVVTMDPLMYDRFHNRIEWHLQPFDSSAYGGLSAGPNHSNDQLDEVRRDLCELHEDIAREYGIDCDRFLPTGQIPSSTTTTPWVDPEVQSPYDSLAPNTPESAVHRSTSVFPSSDSPSIGENAALHLAPSAETNLVVLTLKPNSGVIFPFALPRPDSPKPFGRDNGGHRSPSPVRVPPNNGHGNIGQPVPTGTRSPAPVIETLTTSSTIQHQVTTTTPGQLAFDHRTASALDGESSMTTSPVLSTSMWFTDGGELAETFGVTASRSPIEQANQIAGDETSLTKPLAPRFGVTASRSPVEQLNPITDGETAFTKPLAPRFGVTASRAPDDPLNPITDSPVVIFNNPPLQPLAIDSNNNNEPYSPYLATAEPGRSENTHQASTTTSFCWHCYLPIGGGILIILLLLVCLLAICRHRYKRNRRRQQLMLTGTAHVNSDQHTYPKKLQTVLTGTDLSSSNNKTIKIFAYDSSPPPSYNSFIEDPADLGFIPATIGTVETIEAVHIAPDGNHCSSVTSTNQWALSSCSFNDPTSTGNDPKYASEQQAKQLTNPKTITVNPFVQHQRTNSFNRIPSDGNGPLDSDTMDGQWDRNRLNFSVDQPPAVENQPVHRQQPTIRRASLGSLESEMYPEVFARGQKPKATRRASLNVGVGIPTTQSNKVQRQWSRHPVERTTIEIPEHDDDNEPAIGHAHPSWATSNRQQSLTRDRDLPTTQLDITHPYPSRRHYRPWEYRNGTPLHWHVKGKSEDQ